MFLMLFSVYSWCILTLGELAPKRMRMVNVNLLLITQLVNFNQSLETEVTMVQCSNAAG